MELIKPGINFDFVGRMNLAFGISLALIIISIASIVWHGGLNYGIDFAGGTLVQITQPEPPNLASYISTSGPIGQVTAKVRSPASRSVFSAAMRSSIAGAAGSNAARTSSSSVGMLTPMSSRGSARKSARSSVTTGERVSTTGVNSLAPSTSRHLRVTRYFRSTG